MVKAGIAAEAKSSNRHLLDAVNAGAREDLGHALCRLLRLTAQRYAWLKGAGVALAAGRA